MYSASLFNAGKISAASELQSVFKAFIFDAVAGTSSADLTDAVLKIDKDSDGAIKLHVELGSVMLQFKSSILVETKQTFLIFGRHWVVPLFDGSGFQYRRDDDDGGTAAVVASDWRHKGGGGRRCLWGRREDADSIGERNM
ncbi:hypothetical protein RHSIM_Rhsim09G0205500 [Rhododendron simsii]|uniref:Uncharacterized protein n=1 Tax=Rhododendron simsii TaxID=118357 RepID=A0A834GG22_RHOSS|nr:hypothetical protein RHSIM_Rhsim09G0205500 [Rhododendron simsii]